MYWLSDASMGEADATSVPNSLGQIPSFWGAEKGHFGGLNKWGAKGVEGQDDDYPASGVPEGVNVESLGDGVEGEAPQPQIWGLASSR